jgi:3-oxoadipate enol-lactonase
VTVVFLHPIGLDGDSWALVPTADVTDAVRYTMLWHGGRAQPSTAVTMNAFAADVVQNVAGPLDVIGISMGGSVALELALRWPDRVRSLFVACTTAGGDGGTAQLARAEAVEQHGMEGVLESTMQRWFSADALANSERAGVAYARARLLSDSAPSFAASWRALGAADFTRQLGDIRVPTTVFHAAQDASGSIESRRELAAGIPGARLVTADGPHMIQLERPAEFDSVIANHLAWVSNAVPD